MLTSSVTIISTLQIYTFFYVYIFYANILCRSAHTFPLPR